ncbi:MAG TPA: cache domain-containing protein [Candidatus Acidoferrales bacterium]|nr:cache domain-containing protein [Candidatus Acidoferrales bacterium]
MLNKIITVFALTAAAMFAPRLLAQDDSAAAALAAESTAYCATTVNKDRPTPPSAVTAKVNEACALLEKEGPAAFPKFSGKGSPFIYEGTYIAVQDLNSGEEYVHPILYKMVGQKLKNQKDAKGKPVFVIMSDLVREKGEGWVEYYWPKPGTQEIGHKIAYVKKCTMSNGVEVVVISGTFNFSADDVAKLELH